MILASVPAKVRQSVNVKRKFRNLSKINRPEFERRLLESELFSSPANYVNDFCEQLASVVTRELDRVAPLKVSSQRKSKPITRWLSPEAIKAKRTRRRLERRWRATKNEDDHKEYRKSCRTANKIINSSRSDFMKQRLADCANPGDHWKAVKDILHMNNTSNDMQSDHDNNQHMCNSFIDYFKSKIASIHNTIIGKLPTLSTPPPDRAHVGPTLDAPSPVSPEQVLAILNSIPAKSSPLDFIPTSLLKSCSGVFSLLISTRLANLSFSQGVFPTMFKVAQVTPILKKPGLSSSDLANFRPISNLNNISKILEKLFLSRLLPHINSSSNFNSFQSAYRPHHSTETALTLTLDNVFHAADNGSATLLVSLDLSAAFDSINHNILINRLSSCFGLTGLALDWISLYLHNRRQSVKIGDAYSPLSDITSGVPRGLSSAQFSLLSTPRLSQPLLTLTTSCSNSTLMTLSSTSPYLPRP